MSKARILKELIERAKGGADGLAMDTVSRMARAKDMGFDTSKTYYHGTDADISAFNTDGSGKTSGSGAFFTDNPDLAATYASRGGGNINPVYLRKDSEFNVEAEGANWNRIGEDSQVYSDEAETVSKNNDVLNDLFDTDEYSGTDYSPQDEGDLGYFMGRTLDGEASTDDIAAFARSRGHNSATIDNVIDRGPYGQFHTKGADKPSAITSVFDPSNIRSVNAAFDPAQKESSNLLASLAPAAVGLGALAGGEEAEAGALSKLLKAKYPDVKFSLSESGSSLTLDKIIVPESSRGEGIGKAFMGDLSKMASKQGKSIALTPSGDFGGNKSKLKKFYGDLGYVDNKGKNKDYEISESMYKLPAIGAAGAGTAGALYTPEQNAAQAAPTIAERLQYGRPDSIQPEEFPKLEGAADFLGKYARTPLGPELEGLQGYLRNFGRDRPASDKAMDYLGLGLDFM